MCLPIVRRIVFLQLLLVAAAGAATRSPAVGCATVTILEPATASVQMPSSILLRPGERRALTFSAASDPRTAAWLEIRSAEPIRGDLSLRPDRTVALLVGKTENATVTALSIIYHQY